MTSPGFPAAGTPEHDALVVELRARTRSLPPPDTASPEYAEARRGLVEQIRQLYGEKAAEECLASPRQPWWRALLRCRA